VFGGVRGMSWPGIHLLEVGWVGDGTVANDTGDGEAVVVGEIAVGRWRGLGSGFDPDGDGTGENR